MSSNSGPSEGSGKSARVIDDQSSPRRLTPCSAVSISAAALAGNYFSPYKGKNLSARFDYTINTNHRLFARYSHDGNSGLGPNSGVQLPSHWLRNTNWSDQSLLGVTSSLRSSVVNDFRFSYQYWHNRNLFPNNSDCPDCVGIGLPEVSVSGTNVLIGNTANATQGRDLRKYGFTDSINWQKGRHGIKFGGELENAPGTGFWYLVRAANWCSGSGSYDEEAPSQIGSRDAEIQASGAGCP